jgi:hypothetical protein
VHYNKAKIEAVLYLMSAGQSERAACRAEGINRAAFRSSVLRYRMDDQYARACEAMALDQVNQIEETIADMRAGLPVEIARVEIEARKWLASKLFRPMWGDTIAVRADALHDPALPAGRLDVNRLGAAERETLWGLLEKARIEPPTIQAPLDSLPDRRVEVLIPGDDD